MTVHKSTADPSDRQKPFLNAAGTMWVELEELNVLKRTLVKLSENRLITVIEGSVTLDVNGQDYTFQKGETFYMQQGYEFTSEATENSRLLVACFQSH